MKQHKNLLLFSQLLGECGLAGYIILFLVVKQEQNYILFLLILAQLFVYAYELMLCLHVFRQTGLPRRIDCLAPPSVCHIKTKAFR